jgi:long-chain acyl-CoA synthetase
MLRSNLFSLFASFREFGSDIAVVETRGYRREKQTYAQLLNYAHSWHQALRGRGIQPGDRVLLWGPNSVDWVACFWAVLQCEAAAVPMDIGASLEFVQSVVRDSRVKLIVRGPLQPHFPDGPHSLVFDALPEAMDHPQMSREVPPAAGDTTDRSAIAEILFTSGTTSEPRGVVLTHGNFLANLEPLERGMAPYRKYERWLHPLRFVSLVPLSHVFGQFMALFVPPLLGATVVFENSTQPSEILRTIRREHATALIAVPRMLDLLRSALEREIEARGWSPWFTRASESAVGESFLSRAWRFRRLHRLLGLRFWAFISGGAALSADTEEFFKRIGYAVVQGYGMTETASLISLNHPFRATEGSVGKILPGREFRLAADGEILVRGESVSHRYFEKGSVQSSELYNDGWLSTGDLGDLDAQGNLRFRGRKKNVIVAPSGLNIHPEDLEAALRKQPAIRDVVVIPVETDSHAEPCAVLLLRELIGDHAAAGRAVEEANTSLADYQRIRSWLVWPEPDFPRTPTGKARLGLIASRAQELLQLRRPLDSLAPSNAAGLPALPDSLKELSSLDRVELLASLEHRYQMEINETQFASAETAADLQKLLARPVARRSDYVYPRWTQRFPVCLFRLAVYYALTWPATLLLAHPRISGRENLASLRGPALFVSNHTTRRADIGLILYSLPARHRHRLATAMAGEQLQTMRRPPGDWFFAKRWLWRLNHFLVTSLFNVFPLPQFPGFRESFRFAGESADRGYSILVFPEGIINDRDSPEMVPFQQGIGLLAENLRLPIVPLRLDGVWQMKQQRRRLARAGEIIIRIGAPVRFKEGSSPADIAAELQMLVRSL